MRLVDADALLQCKFSNPIGYTAFSNLVKRQPTIEPERETGEWIMDGEKCGELMWRCSECKVSEAVPTATSFVSWIAYPQWKFCPNCGSYNGGENEG